MKRRSVFFSSLVTTLHPETRFFSQFEAKLKRFEYCFEFFYWSSKSSFYGLQSKIHTERGRKKHGYRAVQLRLQLNVVFDVVVFCLIFVMVSTVFNHSRSVSDHSRPINHNFFKNLDLLVILLFCYIAKFDQCSIMSAETSFLTTNIEILKLQESS